MTISYQLPEVQRLLNAEMAELDATVQVLLYEEPDRNNFSLVLLLGERRAAMSLSHMELLAAGPGVSTFLRHTMRSLYHRLVTTPLTDEEKAQEVLAHVQSSPLRVGDRVQLIKSSTVMGMVPVGALGVVVSVQSAPSFYTHYTVSWMTSGLSLGFLRHQLRLISPSP